jgi:hypothetical protein
MKTPRKYYHQRSPATIARLERCFQQQMRLCEIVKKTGVPSSTIRVIRDRLGYPSTAPKPKPDPRIDEVRKLAAIGHTRREIAYKLGYGETTIGRFVNDNNITINPKLMKRERARPGTATSPDKEREMDLTRPLTLLLRGWSHAPELKQWLLEQRYE